MMLTADWRRFKIRALYSRNARTLAETFVAPDLDTAFALARAKWPGAISWESL